MREIWQDVIGYEELYQVSNLGNVKNLKTKNILKCHNNGYNYLFVCLCKNSKTKNYKIHRLVAQAFIPNPNNLPCINHKDENPLNNNADNLEWCTYQYNNVYGTRLDKFKNTKNKSVLQYSLDGKLIKKWDSIKQASEKLNISNSGIVACAKRKFKQFKGYVWKYAIKEEK